MSKRTLDALFHYRKWLGQEIAQKVPFLQETACMNLDERQKYAVLKIIEIWHPKMSKEVKEIFDKIKKTIEILGYAKWMRTEFTHLALKKGLTTSSEDLAPTFEEEEDLSHKS